MFVPVCFRYSSGFTETFVWRSREYIVVPHTRTCRGFAAHLEDEEGFSYCARTMDLKSGLRSVKRGDLLGVCSNN